MRDPKRIHEIMQLLETLWYQHPDLRLGQLLDWIDTCRENRENHFFYTEDEEWKKLINWLISKD